VPEYVGDVPLIFVLIRVAHLVGVMNGVLVYFHHRAHRMTVKVDHSKQKNCLFFRMGMLVNFYEDDLHWIPMVSNLSTSACRLVQTPLKLQGSTQL
jgi:hypothetical protein